jgi:O-antigen ligase
VDEKSKDVVIRLISWCLIGTTLAITPGWASDPINPIKMLVIVPMSFMCVAIVLSNQAGDLWGRYRYPLILIAFFELWQILVLLLSGGEIYQQIFGTFGRNTGFITYLAFACMFFASMVASSSELLRRFLSVTLLVGSASLLYGVTQAIGSDPINWENPYSPVFGFLGNPNFQSSLIGILSTVVFANLLDQRINKLYRLFGITYLILSLYVIKETQSQQGFLVLSLGVGVVIGFYLLHVNRGLVISYGVIFGLGFLATLFGALNKGPLASILFKDSVTYRGDYWGAGWKMTLDHPIFGVGMDSYGDWYRRSRTLEATLRRGPEIASNAAHNVFLDLSSSGGFPLFIIYILMMLLVVSSAVKVLKRNTEFSPVFAGLLAGWIAFQAQSLISINQIGLAIWGWVLSGLIIGFEINTRKNYVMELPYKWKRTKNVTSQLPAKSVLALFSASVLGVLVSMPVYVASTKYQSALESKNPEMIQAAANFWPLDYSRMVQIAITLDRNNFAAQGISIALDATKAFPDNYYVWETLNAMSSASEGQRAQAVARMKILDPFNPNLK